MIGAARAPVCDRQEGQRAGSARAAFTLIDILVSLTVVAVLIGILLPSLSAVRETTRRVVCSSNIRQHGYGLALYADDHNDYMPPSQFAPPPGVGQYQPERTTTVRRGVDAQQWDGLGWLFELAYLPASGVFYCPSHTGDHPLSLYAPYWFSGAEEELICNYQFRGARYREGGMERGYTRLTDLAVRLPGAALVSDGLRTRDDYNHRVGTNLLRADLGVSWFHDRTGHLGAFVEFLPSSEFDLDSTDRIRDAWDQLDLH